MIKRRMLHHVQLVLIMITLMMVFTSCSYLKKRGNDASDIFDAGFTVSSKLQFGLYLDFFNIMPLGFSSVEGWLLGWGMRHAGTPIYEEKAWGVLLWGSEKRGVGPFNQKDPHQAAGSYENGEERPRYDAGIIRLAAGDSAPPATHHMECSRALHIGFIGISVSIRPVDILDFLIGWSTLDIMGDDNITD